MFTYGDFTPALIAYESVVPCLWLIWWSTTVRHFLWTILGVIKVPKWAEKWLVIFQKGSQRWSFETCNRKNCTKSKTNKVQSFQITLWALLFRSGGGFTYLHMCCRWRLMVILWMHAIQINRSFTYFPWMSMWRGTERNIIWDLQISPGGEQVHGPVGGFFKWQAQERDRRVLY